MSPEHRRPSGHRRPVDDVAMVLLRALRFQRLVAITPMSFSHGESRLRCGDGAGRARAEGERRPRHQGLAPDGRTQGRSAGGQAYLGDQVSKQLAQVASDVRSAVITESGHNIALENPAALARAYLDFFAGL